MMCKFCRFCLLDSQEDVNEINFVSSNYSVEPENEK